MMNGQNSKEKKKEIEQNSLYSFDDCVNYCLRANHVDIKCNDGRLLRKTWKLYWK